MQKVTDYKKTHLCGNLYGGEKCDHLLYAAGNGITVEKKTLQPYYVYCTVDGKCRSMGCAASWTGLSPKWCPKRQKMEANENDSV